MISLENIGSELLPLRCSALPKLMQCPMSVAMEMLQIVDNTSGEAADTGSAMHKAAFHFHSGKGVSDAIRGMRAAVNDYTFADLDKAETMFRAYAADARNQVAVPYLEQRVKLTVPADKADKTGKPIVIHGTLDQVRFEGSYKLWDIKTGSPEGNDMVNDHAYQLAGYWLATEATLGIRITGAGVIRVKDYIRPRGGKQGPVFWETVLDRATCEALMCNVARTVGMVRNNQVNSNPGRQCNWCPLLNVSTCVREAVRLGVV